VRQEIQVYESCTEFYQRYSLPDGAGNTLPRNGHLERRPVHVLVWHLDRAALAEHTIMGVDHHIFIVSMAFTNLDMAEFGLEALELPWNE